MFLASQNSGGNSLITFVSSERINVIVGRIKSAPRRREKYHDEGSVAEKSVGFIQFYANGQTYNISKLCAES